MAQREEGWPLGPQQLNARIGLARNHDFSGSVSFTTSFTASPTFSTISSSDPDTQSTGSLFHDKSITLGSLVGISSWLELSRRSTRRRTTETLKDQNNYKFRPWMFSLCSKVNTDAVDTNNARSLGHFLEVERKAAAANIYRRNQAPAAATTYGPSDFSPVVLISEQNSLFAGDQIAANSSSALSAENSRNSDRELLEQGNKGNGVPLLLSCLHGLPH